MPPTRTIPPAKVMKTERTHEENQERAYIAASRRSDRSLEARVESARRASEIHKRRTGRSLRVTEQDVINEEMYEEEDDDLPLQYRRLTAHLQTGSADFNRRLAAYLTNQVAMRNAVGQMVANPYGHPFPDFGPSPSTMFPSGMMPPQQQVVPQSPGSYRQEPYPSPHNPGFRQIHGRANSSAGTPPTQAGLMDHRRMSTPAGTAQTPQIHTNGIQPDADYVRQTQSAQTPSRMPLSPWQDSPFSVTLPPESQQMLAGTLDLSNPFNQMMMNGSDSFMANPYYPWGDMQGGVKGMPVHPSAYSGMSATLAPAALDTKSDPTSGQSSTPALDSSDNTVPSAGLDLGQMKREGSQQSIPSGHESPAEGFWDNFVQDGSWHEELTSSQ